MNKGEVILYLILQNM